MLALLSAVVCILAAVMQIAVYRTPEIDDTPLRAIARKLSVLSLLTAGGYIIDSWYSNDVRSIFCLIAGMFALSQLIFACENLFEYPFPELKDEEKHRGNVP